MSLKNIGWALQLSRAAYLDAPGAADDEILEGYVSNIIRPVADLAKDPPFINPTSRGPQYNQGGGGKVFDDFKGFFYPWGWNKKNWLVFYRDAPGGKWLQLPEEIPVHMYSGVREINEGHVTSLRAEVEIDVRKSCENCEVPFSGDPDDYVIDAVDGRSRQSLTFAIAPLTHNVAPISNQVLEMAGFVRLSSTVLDGIGALELVVFPKFKVLDTDKNDFEPDYANFVSAIETGSIVRAPYKPYINTIPINFISQPAVRVMAGSTLERVQSKSVAYNWRREVVDDAVAKTLVPSKIFAHYIQDLPICPLEDAAALKNFPRGCLTSKDQYNIDLKFKWLRLLVNTLGFCWSRDRITSFSDEGPVYESQHIFETFLAKSKLKVLFPDIHGLFYLETGALTKVGKVNFGNKEAENLLKGFIRHIEKYAQLENSVHSDDIGKGAKEAGTVVSEIKKWYEKSDKNELGILRDWLNVVVVEAVSEKVFSPPGQI